MTLASRTGAGTGPNDVVVSSAGAIVAGATGMDAVWQRIVSGQAPADRTGYSLKGFPAAKHLADRKMLKAVSEPDGVGLAAVEELKRGLVPGEGMYDPWRMGLYVGSRPGSDCDHEYYAEAMHAARDASGRVNAREFGATCMSARPTTLLIGLPNNVLCYGSMILGLHGPNSNYTSLFLGGMHAVINGMRRVSRRQLDFVAVGGCSWHASEEVWHGSFVQRGIARRDAGASGAYSDRPAGMVPADGAVFLACERRASTVSRGGTVLATLLGGALTTDGLGPLAVDESGKALEQAVRETLRQAGVGAADVGLVLGTGLGYSTVDAVERTALRRIFGASDGAVPAFGCLSGILGQLMEAGGLLEIGLAGRIREAGRLPASLRADGMLAAGFGDRVDPERPCTLVVRASPWGEYGCVLIR